MYNAEQKELYISQLKTSAGKSDAQYMFKATEQIEEKNNADICSFSNELISEALTPIAGIKTKAHKQMVLKFKTYIKWCIKNNITNTNTDALKFNIDMIGLDLFYTQTVSSPGHLQSCLDEIFTPEDELGTDNIYRAFLWLAFAGMEKDDILMLKSTDFDIKNKCVYGRENESYHLPDQSLNVIKICAEATHFNYTHARYTKYWERVQSDQLLRNVKSELTDNTIRKRLREARFDAQGNLKTKMELTYSHVWLSGIFFRARISEITENRKPNFLDIAAREVGEFNDFAVIKSKEYLRDYTRWKAAFPA